MSPLLNATLTAAELVAQISEATYTEAGFFTASLEGTTLVIQVTGETNLEISGLDELGIASGTIPYVDGVLITGDVNILNTVFDGQNVTPTDGIAAFTQAVDDARAVIDFVHTY